MKIKPILLGLFIVISVISCKKEPDDGQSYVVLVSFDGCRWDYPEKYDARNFIKLGTQGVRAERVISSFPTKTFPNHYTLATGLYPDHHGLINNTFYAPDLDLRYSIGDRSMVENPDFYHGEPIWNTAEKQGIKSAAFFWVGSEAPIQGMHPSYWKKYDGSVPFKARVDSVVNWLQKPIESRPRLVMLYFQQPDGIGHEYGPDHKKTGQVMKEMDRVLGYLRKELDKLPVSEQINLIVTSDHGMGPISTDKYANIEQILKAHWIKKMEGGNPVFLIDAVAGYEDSIVHAVNSETGVKAYTKEEIPAHFNYGTHPRFPDILLVADSSWSVGVGDNNMGYSGGAHGYNPANTDMHNIFYATGPGFKKGYIHPPFENVNIYPLVAHLLNITPARSDGNLSNVEAMLEE